MILDFGSFTRRGMLVHHVHTAKRWSEGVGQCTERVEGARPGRRRKKIERPPTCQQWLNDRSIESASSREIPMILMALVFTDGIKLSKV